MGADPLAKGGEEPPHKTETDISAKADASLCGPASEHAHGARVRDEASG